MKNQSKIFTSVLTLCGIIGIYVVTAQSLHDNETGLKNSLSGKISDNTPTEASNETSTDTQRNLSATTLTTPTTTKSQPIKAQPNKTQAPGNSTFWAIFSAVVVSVPAHSA